MGDWLFAQSGFAVYISLFLLLMGGAIGLPIPEDIPLIFGGVLIHRGHVDVGAVFLTCYLGIIIGDAIIFFIGRKLGSSAQKRDWISSRFSPELIAKTKHELEKRRVFTIILARHLFYLRTVTFLTCGAVRMSFRKFFVADAFAALISASLMLGIGYLFSDQYDYLFGLIKKTKYAVLLISLIGAGGVYWYIRKRRAKIL